MFIREYVTNNKKTGTCYVTHRLVESVKTEKGPRLKDCHAPGHALPCPGLKWRKLAALLESRLAGRISLFEEEFPALAEAADKAFEHYRFVQARRKERVTQKENRETKAGRRAKYYNWLFPLFRAGTGGQCILGALGLRPDFSVRRF